VCVFYSEEHAPVLTNSTVNISCSLSISTHGAISLSVSGLAAGCLTDIAQCCTVLCSAVKEWSMDAAMLLLINH
jgi:hypothetical protein